MVEDVVAEGIGSANSIGGGDDQCQYKHRLGVRGWISKPYPPPAFLDQVLVTKPSGLWPGSTGHQTGYSVACDIYIYIGLITKLVFKFGSKKFKFSAFKMFQLNP